MKRFFETKLWEDPWYRRLLLKQKLLWNFLYSICDNAGVWKIDLELASFYIGEAISIDDISALNNEKERVAIFADNTLILVRDFIPFQIGNIKGNNLTNLQKNSLKLFEDYTNNKGLNDADFNIVTGKLRVAIGYKYKGKGKGKSKSKSKDKIIDNMPVTIYYRQFAHLSITVEDNQKLLNAGNTQLEINDIYDSIENYKKNTNYKSLYLTAKKWLNKEKKTKEQDDDKPKNIDY